MVFDEVFALKMEDQITREVITNSPPFSFNRFHGVVVRFGNAMATRSKTQRAATNEVCW